MEAGTQFTPSNVSHVEALLQLPLLAERYGGGALKVTLVLPVLGPVLVAVIVTVSTTVSRVLMRNVPLESVLVLSPKVPSPLLSNCTLPVPLIVTTVLLSATTVSLRMS